MPEQSDFLNWKVLRKSLLKTLCHSSLKRKFCREIALWFGYSSCRVLKVSKQLYEAFGSIQELASADVEAIAAVDGLERLFAKSAILPKEEAQVLLKELETYGVNLAILGKGSR